MSKYDIKKLNDDYDLLDNNEKLAMRYGAEGRDLSDVIRSSTEKITSPNKIFDAWDKGTNMRKDGTSRDFLERIEKKEMDDLLTSINKKKNANGISAEPVKDIWGNDLLNDTRKNRKKEGASAEKMPYIWNSDTPVKPQPMPRVNNALSNTRDYDIMYLSDDTGSGGTNSSVKTTRTNTANYTESSKTNVTYGYPDVNVVGGIQSRLNELGYTDVDITGVFNAKTEAGIKKIQEKRGLPVTGVLDDKTKKAMGFSNDYSVSRKGENATPWHAPESPPFNMEAYKRKQDAEKYYEDYKNKEALAKFLGCLFTGFGSLKDAAPSGADLAEENKTPETQSDYLLQGGNAIDNAN